MSCLNTPRLMRMTNKRKERLNSGILAPNLVKKKAKRRITTCHQVEVTRARRKAEKKRRKPPAVRKTPITS
ncbi:hypothetical protein OESDEN_17006 [Oesophagostomum dentatum]|uniref:Uncharacterized protein n=1 Tax=Oesophagostomum dentatum TaxID=61180 RepID=A0A0B1SID0_OESDE|nr:hypothetical protein OESDEN_17006 [Oesophagostomum dentatum]